MAFYDTVFSQPQSRVASATEFDSTGRLGVFIGATAAGAMLGAAAGMTIGLIHPYIALGGVAVLAGLSAFYAGKSFMDCARARSLPVAGVLALHIISLIVWPATLAFAPAYATLALYGAFGSLLFFAATMRMNNACVGRLAAHSMLLAAAGAYQGLYALMS